MIRRPPRSTLFPLHDALPISRAQARRRNAQWRRALLLRLRDLRWRSEEHTSELQSRPHLVCRLLLEKKTNNSILRSLAVRVGLLIPLASTATRCVITSHLLTC